MDMTTSKISLLMFVHLFAYVWDRPGKSKDPYSRDQGIQAGSELSELV